VGACVRVFFFLKTPGPHSFFFFSSFVSYETNDGVFSQRRGTSPVSLLYPPPPMPINTLYACLCMVLESWNFLRSQAAPGGHQGGRGAVEKTFKGLMGATCAAALSALMHAAVASRTAALKAGTVE